MKKLLPLVSLMISLNLTAQIPGANLQKAYQFTNGSLQNVFNPGTNDLVKTGTASTLLSSNLSVVDNAISLNGDYMNGGTSTGNTNFSASFWIKTSTIDANNRYIFSQFNPTPGFGVQCYLNNGKITYGGAYKAGGSASTFDTVTSTVGVADGEWHHVVVSALKIVGGGVSPPTYFRYYLYVDNVLQGTRNGLGTNVVKQLLDNTTDFMVGVDNNLAEMKYEDAIDDIYFYERAINTIEIQQLYEANLPVRIIYVNHAATGSNDGSSWTDAYVHMQSALAAFGPKNEIWVASGTYTPHATDRKTTFSIPDDGILYGGFNGTETDVSQRDFKTNVTTLSGDLFGNDNANLIETEVTRQDNSYHVVSIRGTAQNVIVDGFTISGGNANGSFNVSCATAAASQFNDQRGAAIYTNPYGLNHQTTGAIRNCIIENNTSTNAAVYSSFTPCGVTDVTTDMDFESCIVRNNYSGTLSAFMFLGSSGFNIFSNGSIVNSLFHDNVSNSFASCIYLFSSNSNGGNTSGIDVDIVNSTFSNNTGPSGNVIRMERAANTNLTNSIIYGNDSATPISLITSGSVVANSIIEGGQLGATNADPLFNDETTDDYTLNCASPAVDAGGVSGVVLPPTDLSGDPRVVSSLDMGAFEAAPSFGSVTAVAKDISARLDETGNLTIAPEDLDGGSGTICGNTFSLALDVDTFTCTELGDNTVQLTATDGGVSMATATVTVLPYINTQDITVLLDQSGNGIITTGDVDNGTQTACSGVVLSLNQTAFTCADIGPQNVALTVDDGNGNTEDVNIEVVVEDQTAPVAVGQDFAVILSGNEAVITTADIDNGSTDNCGFTLSLSKTNFSCEDIGENTITLTVEDTSGNIATAEVSVTVSSEIVDETVTAAETDFCIDGSTGTTISIGSSVVGVNYSLRNSDNIPIAGPITGTGAGIDFSTGALPQTTTFNVYAELDVEENNSLDFDGVDDYLSASDPGFDYGNGYTIEAWVNAPSPGSSHRPIFSIGNSSVSDIEVYIQQGTNAFVVSHDRGETNFGGYGFATPPFNQLFHLAVTYDGTTIKVYYDGVEQTITDSSFPPAGPMVKTAGHNMKIGEVSNTAFGAGGAFFNGQLDEVRIWDSARSATEILANNDDCLSGSETGLVAFYNFNEGADLVATDLVAGNDATLTNMNASTVWLDGTISCGEACGFQMTTEVTIGDATAPTAVTQNITVTQDISGETMITPDQINNGSSDNCTTAENLVLTLDQDTFGCDQAGAQTVTLTVSDEEGNEAAATATVTITPLLENKTVTTPQTSICPGAETTISVAASQTGIQYYLRNAGEEIVDGPILGNGNTLDFNTGTVTETTTFNVFASLDPPLDEAMDLAGSGGYVTIPSTPSLQLDANWTIEAWVKPASATASMNIVETYDQNGGFILRAESGNWVAYAMNTGSLASIVTSAGGVVSGQWTHVAATFNETTDELKIYVDGVLSTTNPAATIDQRGSLDDIKLGARGDDEAVQGQHVQDEVRIWNVERSAEEISDHRSESLSGSEPGLVAYYDYNDLEFVAAAMTIVDKTANGNNGTVMGIYTIENFVEGPINNMTTGCGIQMTATQTITPEDNEAPMAIAMDISVRLDVNGQVTVSAADVDNGSTDNCGTVTITLAAALGDPLGDQVQSVAGILFDTNDIGSNQVTLTVEDESGNVSSADATVTVSPFKLDQEITFNELVGKTYGDAAFNLIATSTSNLAVSFTVVSGPGSVSGSTVSVTGAGTIVLEANQAGDDNYAPADPVQQSIEVSKAALNLIADDQTVSFGAAIPQLTFSYDGFVNGESETDLNATISISTTAGAEEGQANAGTYPITISVSASEAGDNYNFHVTDATLTIEKADQIITISPIDDKEPTDADFDVTASVDSELALIYEVSGPATIVGTTITLDGTEGTVTVTVSQEGDINHNTSSATETFDVVVVLAIGDELGAVKIYPNPVVDHLIIESSEKVNIRFFSLDGKLAKSLIDVSGEVNVQNLETGTYLMEITTRNNRKFERVIKTN